LGQSRKAPEDGRVGFSYGPTGEREITLRRVFDAPRARVFTAISTPEQLQRWFNTEPGASLEGEIKAGGEWRALDGNGEITMCGVVREFVPPERFVSTEWSKGAAPYPDEILAATVLVEQDGKTLFVETFTFDSTEARDVAIDTGLELVYREAFANLDELLLSFD